MRLDERHVLGEAGMYGDKKESRDSYDSPRLDMDDGNTDGRAYPVS